MSGCCRKNQRVIVASIVAWMIVGGLPLPLLHAHDAVIGASASELVVNHLAKRHAQVACAHVAFAESGCQYCQALSPGRSACTADSATNPKCIHLHWLSLAELATSDDSPPANEQRTELWNTLPPLAASLAPTIQETLSVVCVVPIHCEPVTPASSATNVPLDGKSGTASKALLACGTRLNC